MRGLKVLLGLLVVAVIIFIGKSTLASKEAKIREAKTPKKDILTIEVIKVKSGDIESSKRFLAQIKSLKSVKISTKMVGYIEKIYVKDGDSVKKGSPLISIDSDEIDSNIRVLELTLKQQKIDFTLAKDIFNRDRALYKIGGVSQERLNTSTVIMQGKESAMDSTKERIEQLLKQKDYLNIEAPFDGIVEKVLIYEGDLAVVGKAILRMNNREQELLISYSFDDNQIKKGQKVLYRGEEIGEIAVVQSVAKRGLAEAKVALYKPLNEPMDSSINIEILMAHKRGSIIPNSAVIHKKDGNYIMVYRDKKFEAVKVEVILSDSRESIINISPKEYIAIGDETLLSKLEAYRQVNIKKIDSRSER